MLPFGSITSIIPLFVLAFAYVVFLGTSVISKDKQDATLYHSGDKVLKVDGHSSDRHERTEKTLDLGLQLQADQAVEEESFKPFRSDNSYVLIRIPERFKIPESFKISFSIRPPPFFS